MGEKNADQDFYDAAAREALTARDSGDMDALGSTVGHVLAEANDDPRDTLANLSDAIRRNR